jgi:hypothetical protein
MTDATPEPDDVQDEDLQDQDAEPSLNAPEEGRPDGVTATDEQDDDDADH